MAQAKPKVNNVLDLEDIAQLCDVQHNTAVMWRKRGRLPKPSGFVSGKPWWSRARITEWAKEHGYPNGPTLKLTLGTPVSR